MTDTTAPTGAIEAKTAEQLAAECKRLADSYADGEYTEGYYGSVRSALHAAIDALAALSHPAVPLRLEACDAAASELARVKLALKDPARVHVSMLRGEIAIPDMRSLVHLHGEEALRRWDAAAAPSPAPAPNDDHDADVADIIAGALQTSRGHAYELMEAALASRWHDPAPAPHATQEATRQDERAEFEVIAHNGGDVEHVATTSGHRETALREAMGYAHGYLSEVANVDVVEVKRTVVAAMSSTPGAQPSNHQPSNPGQSSESGAQP